MAGMDVLSVQEAARRLGVSEQRVRALAAEHRIPAEKVGGRWLVRSSELLAGPASNRRPGRPMKPGSAWAFLWLLSGRRPGWLSPSQLSRLRYRSHGGSEELVARVRGRCRVESYRVHSGMLSRLRDDPRLVLSGISAVRDHSVDLIVGDELEAYVKASDFPRLIKDFQAVEAERANCRFRIVDDDSWPFDEAERVAPPIVVAVDLMESSDQRVARAGTDLFARALQR